MDVRKFLRIVTGVSGCVFVSMLAASIAFTAQLGVPLRSENEGALFHIIAVMPAGKNTFYARAAESMRIHAKRSNAALQVLEYPQDAAPSAIARILRLAMELEPDGIIISALPDPAINSAVREISAAGIPLVAFESDLPGSSRAAFVGTNPYGIGVLAAEAVAELLPKRANVALILSHGIVKGGTKAATVAAGFIYGARKKNGIHLALTKTADDALSAGDEIIRDLLSDDSTITVAVFIGAREAENAARALIEYDKVGHIALIGFDDEAALLELIRLGVVSAAIARSPEKFGAEAVGAAITLAKGGRVSAFIDPGLRIIKKDEL